MVEKPSARNDESIRSDASPGAEGDTADEYATKPVQADPPSKPVTPASHWPSWNRRWVMGVLGALVLAAVLIFGVPWIRLALNTVSTDDAYVGNGKSIKIWQDYWLPRKHPPPLLNRLYPIH